MWVRWRGEKMDFYWLKPSPPPMTRLGRCWTRLVRCTWSDSQTTTPVITRVLWTVTEPKKCCWSSKSHRCSRQKLMPDTYTICTTYLLCILSFSVLGSTTLFLIVDIFWRSPTTMYWNPKFLSFIWEEKFGSVDTQFITQ